MSTEANNNDLNKIEATKMDVIDSKENNVVTEAYLKLPETSSISDFLEIPMRFRPAKEIIEAYLEEETLLTHCVKTQNITAVEVLIQCGAFPDAPNKKGVTPISAAAHKGNTAIMQLLIDAGASVNAINQSGSTALIQASHFGHIAAVKILICNGAVADTSNNKGTTALMRASQEGHVEISKVLIQAHVDVNKKNNEGMNALMLASQRGHSDIVVILIKAGAVMDEQTSQGSTALMLACKRGHDKCAEVLTSMGAEIFMRDRRGRTAKDTATRRSHFGLLCWLDTQVQTRRIQEFRHSYRSMQLAQLRKSFLKQKTVLNPIEQCVHQLVSEVKQLGITSAGEIMRIAAVENIDDSLNSNLNGENPSILSEFLVSSMALPIYSKLPEVSVQQIITMLNYDNLLIIQTTPQYPNSDLQISRKIPGYADWYWTSLLQRCLGLPAGLFELIAEFLPLPRIWQWSLVKIKRRCKLAPYQAIVDCCILMDEIINDTNIFYGKNNKNMLVKINKCPQFHSYLIEQMGMPPGLLTSLCTWADVQSLIARCSESELSFKSQMARSLHATAIALYRWYRNRSSAVKALNLHAASSVSLAIASSIQFSGTGKIHYGNGLQDDVDEPDMMEATDAGVEGSDNENDGIAMDQDTENELGVNDGDPDDLLDDSDDDNNHHIHHNVMFVNGI
eukprot:gene14990-20164_t